MSYFDDHEPWLTGLTRRGRALPPRYARVDSQTTCWRCGRVVRIANTEEGWKPVEDGVLHQCAQAAGIDDFPETAP